MKVYKLQSGAIVGLLNKPIYFGKLRLNAVVLKGANRLLSSGDFLCLHEVMEGFDEIL